jgi:hypothetical protein
MVGMGAGAGAEVCNVGERFLNQGHPLFSDFQAVQVILDTN